MKKVGLSSLFLALVISMSAQNLLTIEDESISLLEFESIFYKNNSDVVITKEYLDDYMELFVNFKLKVKESKELGFDTLPSFISELEGYRKQLAEPYLKNKEFDQKMLTEAYERMKVDINASHILISVDEKSTIKEVEIARNKILEIRNSILSKNITFENAAIKYSDDKSAIRNSGNLGYFTAFMMVYDFETVAYNTNVNEISLPIKTKYGFHLIKVNDRRTAVGSVKVAHIMFKTGEGADSLKITDAEKKINQAKELLNNGENFSDVAERFSEDRVTAVKGGSLPSFGVGKMVPEFERVAFGLKEVKDISEPFKTAYGWHILTLLEKNQISDFEDIKIDLAKKIKRDSRSKLSELALYEKLRNTYKVSNKPQIYKAFRKISAKKVSNGSFKIVIKNNSELLTIDNLSITINDFSEFILENQNTGNDIDILYTQFIDQELLNYEENQLSIKYPEYKALFNEYKEGILLFDLTNKKVWGKAVNDTVGLNNFFNRNQSSYLWGERVEATIYTCVNLEIAKKVKRDIYKKNRKLLTDKEILLKNNKTSALSLQIENKKFNKGDNKYIDSIPWKKGTSKDIVLKDGTYIIIDISNILPSGNKTIDEIKGKVISDYQEELEGEWIDNLKSKYSVLIDKKMLYSLIK